MADGLEMDRIKTKFGWLLQLRRELRLMNKRDKMFVLEKERKKERNTRQTKTKRYVVKERGKRKRQIDKQRRKYKF
jgi:hypothetical protein